MTTARSDAPLPPIIQHVLHPSDFSDASRTAFVHALKAALIAKAKLTLIHTTEDDNRDWSEFPGIRETLENWEVLPRGSSPEDVIELGIEASKIIGRGRDPVKGVLAYLEEHDDVDVVILATRHHGLDWLQKSVSEPIARKSREITLFVPEESTGFISPEKGKVTLRNILIPVAETPRSGPAIAGAARLVRQLQCEQGTFTILHVGEEAPPVATVKVPGWKWKTVVKQGNVIDVILDTACKTIADLIVMATDGRNGFLDAIRGSHSERVLRHAPCPVLAIPESSYTATKIEKAEHADWYRERPKPIRRRPAASA